MVSFQCDGCADVVKKPKLDAHRSRCHTTFTCIDCSTTFPGPKQYNAHTSCISEAQKYEKSLYKGKPAKNNNVRGSNTFNRPGPKSRGTGPNDQPLGQTAKMVYTPPNELEDSKPSASSVPLNSAPVPTPAPAPTPAAPASIPTTPTVDAPAALNGTKDEPMTVSDKKDKKRKKREPPPPGETRAERKKRKKEERAVKKKEKLRKKAQEKASKAAETKARKEAKQALKFGGAAKMATRATETSEPLVELVDSTEIVGASMEESAIPVVDGQVVQPQPNASQAEQDDEGSKHKEKKEKKKKRKDGSKISGVLEDSNAMEVDATLEPEPASTTEKKSKKRKRSDEDVGGKDDTEEEETRASLEKLSFKERAKAEKKARKAEKAAKKARLSAADA